MSSADAEVKLKDFENLFRLDGKVAVVTGGSRGLGLNVASGLLQAGCSKVYITSRKAAACEAAVKALNALPNKKPGAEAISVPADIADYKEIERLVAEVSKTTSHIDILFANAGATWGAPFDETPEAMFSKVINLNIKSVFYCVQKFEPLLAKKATRADPSRVVTTASIAGIGLGSLGQNATYSYSASKAAAIHMSKHFAVELGQRHITSNAIAPGFYPTKMSNGLLEMGGGADRMAAMVPTGRLGMPEDIAGLVVFLCSRAGSHLNGSVIATDGGEVLARL